MSGSLKIDLNVPCSLSQLILLPSIKLLISELIIYLSNLEPISSTSSVVKNALLFFIKVFIILLLLSITIPIVSSNSVLLTLGTCIRSDEQFPRIIVSSTIAKSVKLGIGISK